MAHCNLHSALFWAVVALLYFRIHVTAEDVSWGESQTYQPAQKSYGVVCL